MTETYDDFKEKVRSSANIVDVVSEYVALKRKGHKHWGCCPFHGEKTPSFTVDADKKFFYCFGCNEGGDIFKFIMKIENCTFPEAVKLLAAKQGIAVPEYHRSPEEQKREEEKKELVDINALANRFFIACLTKTDYGKNPLRYLEERGITTEIIERFGIGYALDSYDSLLTNLSKRNCDPEKMVRVGLLRTSQNGKKYDSFRNRIMIPIKDPRGNIVGYGGRILGAGEPKYLNTGSTEIFDKRNILFGLDVALANIKAMKQAIVVEGYMDAISLFAKGIENVVATLGTAFTLEQAKLLKRISDEVICAYDNDKAGKLNAIRAVSIAKSINLKVRVLEIQDVKDPDEYVRKYGKVAFEGLVTKAIDGTEFQIKHTIEQGNITNLAGKVETVSNVLPFVVECNNEIEVASYVRMIAQLLTLDEDLIMSEYRKIKQTHKKNANEIKTTSKKNVSIESTVVEQAERNLIYLSLQYPKIVAAYANAIAETGFTSDIRNEVYKIIIKENDKNIDQIVGCLSAIEEVEFANEVNIILSGDLGLINLEDAQVKKIILDYLLQMKKAHLEVEYNKHRLLADQYEKANDERFLEELNFMQKIKGEIQKLYGN